MFKIVKATAASFAVLGIVAVLTIGTKAGQELKSYKDNLNSYNKILREMSNEESTYDAFVVTIIM